MTLEEYAIELGVSISIEQLIDSHRVLRSRSLQNIAERNKELTEIYERVEKQAMDATWVKWDDLGKMTLAEIAYRALGDK